MGSYLAASDTKKTVAYEISKDAFVKDIIKSTIALDDKQLEAVYGITKDEFNRLMLAIHDKTESSWVLNGRILNIYSDGTIKMSEARGYEPKKNASGVTSFQGGQTLINELGTEAVITPGGTLTALPSKTGIVPADITRNVWALGEVAPTLVAQLSSLNQKALTGNAGNTTYEEGQYIDNLTMNVYPTKDYDMDKLLSEARAKAKLTRHNN